MHMHVARRFLQVLGDGAKLAQYLESRGQQEMAADVWVQVAQVEKAITTYTQVLEVPLLCNHHFV